MVIGNESVTDPSSASSMNLPKPRRRVVLLGASNLTRSFPLIVSLLQDLWCEPIEIMAAIGHGRSFGQSSSVFGRKILEIFSSKLWDDLEARPPLPTHALVTDIGNDLLYGNEPEQLLNWVSGCVERLSQVDAEILIGQLPCASVNQLSKTKFLLFRTLLFPQSKLTLEVAKESAEWLNRQLVELAQIEKRTIFSGKNEWYGFDPVHIRKSVAVSAWQEIFAHWPDVEANKKISRPSLWRAAYLQSLPPFERAWLGISRRRDQPSGRLSDGTTISLY